MNKPSLFFSFIFILGFHLLPAQPTQNPVPSPSRQDFSGILSFLSSDLMEGREAGTRGSSISAVYIASMMQMNGLLPYGDPENGDGSGSSGKRNQTYFQNFNMIRCRVEKSSLSLIMNAPEGESSILFIPGTDYKVDPVRFGREAEAALVFAGYGIDAPGKGYSDYAGIDVRNRIVVILDGYPGHTDTTSASWKKLGSSFGEDFAELSAKLRTAEEHGALAVVFVGQDVLPSPTDSTSQKEYDDENPRHYLPGETEKLTIPCFRIGADAARLLFDDSGIDIPGFELKSARDLFPASGSIAGKKIRFSLTIKSEAVAISNVLGTIRGKDTTRNIIVGAHYDHLGIRKGLIYNGADDNASGVAGILSLAKAWSNQVEKPSCNIIFATWTGEEKGKLGSTYFARNSRIVPDRLSLVINLDMISRSAPEDTAAKMLSIGTMTISEDLRNIATSSNALLKQPFILDLWDVTGHAGSDYAPFYARKVPIVTFHSGWNADYHTPLDDTGKTDPAKTERILKIANDFLWRASLSNPIRSGGIISH